MPVSLIHAGRPTGVLAPRIIRRTARSCAVCGKTRCQDAKACRTAFGTTEWLECPACAGSGYDTTGFQLYCPDCGGAKVLEVEIIDAPGVVE
ncbi:hypothetical protein JCM4814A_12130 [Streptomyces phaeofaciens JCM 4814]|uniref:Uncharacterized protein n=1 Tax=Streptomyces phaeofaciens TaxID=68254 RepID=A0A918HI76_9ACTN|nr:hypothetical protein [Streptomyces phaeofaciens]GGT60606.1 hypothetical protein GCM10010226_42660 [Streptomyces phaeofaciens]